MTAALTPARQQMRDTVSPSASADDASPVVTIDLDRAEIVAANASGAEAIGLFPYASFPIALDASTPALARLRELAALGIANGKSIERLTFWSNGRLRSLPCTVIREGANGSGFFVLRIIGENGTGAASVGAQLRDEDKDPARSASQRSVSRPSLATAEALNEITRRIRESDFSAPLSDVPGITADRQPFATAAATGMPRTLDEKQDNRPIRADERTPSSLLDPDHLAKLAHELKTPLTAIAAAAEVMRDERLGPMKNGRYLTYAADIHENASHALDVITALLSESGKPETAAPRLIALDLNALVERTVSSVQALAQSRGLTLMFEAEKSRPHVAANPTSLRQILLNLLTNAIKFTPPGGDIRIVTGYLADDRVFLVVRDTGCGMNGKKATEAVEPPEEKTQPWLTGSGIGLPLVQRLVRDMSAEIEIDSAPGKGTVVLIAFGDFARWPT